jgi:glycoside hydrolase-like protein
MPLSGKVESVNAGLRGFDCDGRSGNKLTAELAKAFRAAGYRFCLRYVPREPKAKTVKYDLKADEAELILDAGLALMVVQHFPGAGWRPTGELGKSYGAFAVKWAKEMVGLPAGVSMFCDMEGVAADQPQKDVIEHCIAWHGEVKAAGYSPGLYVGDAAKLGGQTIKDRLGMFNHFWLAFTEKFTIPGRPFELRQFSVGKNAPERPPAAAGFRFQRDETDSEAGRALKWLVRP